MTVQPQENQAQPTKPENDKEVNFRAFEAKMQRQIEQERQARLQAEQERDEALKQARKPYKDDDDDDDSEPYVDKKRLNKRLDRFAEDMEKKIDRKAEEKAAMMIEQERRGSYLKENPDFNQVMQPETIQKFADKNPRLAEKILRMPEGFERQQLVYENIKAMGIDKPEQKQPSIQEKIDSNRRSPYYQPSGVGTAPYNGAGDFSPSGQQNAYKKMQELKNRLRI